ncbi:hypothetical protein ACJX0J_028505, partial [Zea mays]
LHKKSGILFYTISLDTSITLSLYRSTLHSVILFGKNLIWEEGIRGDIMGDFGGCQELEMHCLFLDFLGAIFIFIMNTDTNTYISFQGLFLIITTSQAEESTAPDVGRSKSPAIAIREDLNPYVCIFLGLEEISISICVHY